MLDSSWTLNSILKQIKPQLIINLTLVNVWRKTAHEHFAGVGLRWWREGGRAAGTAIPTAAAALLRTGRTGAIGAR